MLDKSHQTFQAQRTAAAQTNFIKLSSIEQRL